MRHYATHSTVQTRGPEALVRLLGQSLAIAGLEQEIDRVARSNAKVLITGESGAGKELVARSIHLRGSRANRIFVTVNCAGLPETLLETELFGHVKGSFTGAYRDKTGKLETAHLGTVCLDEMGEMTPRMQGLLLRFLETGELQKVGAEGVGRTVDVRVIAVTNRDLQELMRQGAFRADLFYRLNVIHIVVPPLRERREDISLLVDHFLSRLGAQNQRGVMTVSPEAMKVLTEYSWPGNVRELVNVVERLVVTVSGSVIDPGHLPHEMCEQGRVALRQKRDRRRTVVDDLYQQIMEDRQSFWTTAYPRFMNREVTRDHVREIVRRGLEEARGNYKIVARLFNMEAGDYKRFLNFLRKHDCQVPFQDYR